VPDVGSVAAKLSQLDIVSVFARAILEDEYQFVLTAIERSLPTTVTRLPLRRWSITKKSA
jgi:hypothetical protein